MANAERIRVWHQDEFAPTSGQVTFILSTAPIDLASVSVIVNGVEYDDVADFILSGVTLTWLNTEFTMQPGDVVLVRYV